MKIAAVTGGIASGKSTVLRELSALLPAPSISSDEIVHRLYEEADVLEEVRSRFGEAVIDDGGLSRRKLGRLVFADEEAREWLEELLHPRVLRSIEVWKTEKSRETASDWALVEVPLLYEVDFPLTRDIDVVVGCSFSTQLERIERRDQLNEEQARSRIRVQLPIEQKLIHADVVLWNDGSESVLEQLIRLAADRIQSISS